MRTKSSCIRNHATLCVKILLTLPDACWSAICPGTGPNNSARSFGMLREIATNQIEAGQQVSLVWGMENRDRTGKGGSSFRATMLLINQIDLADKFVILSQLKGTNGRMQIKNVHLWPRGFLPRAPRRIPKQIAEPYRALNFYDFSCLSALRFIYN